MERVPMSVLVLAKIEKIYPNHNGGAPTVDLKVLGKVKLDKVLPGEKPCQ
jgi:hypothetical protein